MISHLIRRSRTQAQYRIVSEHCLIKNSFINGTIKSAMATDLGSVSIMERYYGP